MKKDFFHEEKQKAIDEIGIPETPEEVAAMLQYFEMYTPPEMEQSGLSFTVGKARMPKMDLSRAGRG